MSNTTRELQHVSLQMSCGWSFSPVHRGRTAVSPRFQRWASPTSCQMQLHVSDINWKWMSIFPQMSNYSWASDPCSRSLKTGLVLKVEVKRIHYVSCHFLEFSSFLTDLVALKICQSGIIDVTESNDHFFFTAELKCSVYSPTQLKRATCLWHKTNMFTSFIIFTWILFLNQTDCKYWFQCLNASWLN